MIHYRKLRDLKIAMGNLVLDDMLVVTLFEDIPELQEFTFLRNQEYDDNNYYDNTRVTSVNGHVWDYDNYSNLGEGILSEFGIDEENKKSELPLIPESKVHWIEDVVGFVAEKYDRHQEDYTFRRDEFKREHYNVHDGGTSKKNGHVDSKQIAERKYFLAYLSGNKLPDSFFLKNDIKYALYYALDHGRFGRETEYKLFAKKGELHNALEYARHIIKGRLPEDVENFFVLDADEDERPSLQDYMREFMLLEKAS